jgi:hypothetical protein
MAKTDKLKGMNAEALAALERLGASPQEAQPSASSADELSTEIPLARPAAKTVRRAIEPPAARVPRWYRVAAPLMFASGGALIIIGLWAAGAMIYMRTTTPTTPDFQSQYPLIRWSADVGENGGYTDDSKMMAAAMLACIPVAGLMGGMVLVMRRQIRAADGRR